MKVTYFHRRWIEGDGQHSMEGVFAVVRSHLPSSIETVVRESRFPSWGVWRRLFNLIEAPFVQSDVNHITGDIHYVAALLRKRRTVLTIHDIGTYHDLAGFRKRAFRFFWVTMPIRRSRIVIVPSGATRDDVVAVAGCPPEKLRVIPVPVAPGYRHAPKEFDTRHPMLLAIGTKPNKNLDRLIAALEGLPCRLEVVGTLSPAQAERLTAMGIAHHDGADRTEAEMQELFRIADIVSYVSIREGFGLPVAEAHAVGRPVVTSNIAPMREVAGGAACLIDPFDVDDIRRGIARIIEDPDYRAALIAAGLQNARRFTPELVAERYVEVYQEIAG